MNRDNLRLEMQKLQDQLQQQRKDTSNLKAELLQQQQTMRIDVKTDVQKLTTDMLGLAKNINGIHDEVDGLADYMGGLSGNMDTLRTDIGTVASHVESLSLKAEKQNQKLQQNLTKEIQGLLSEFKTSMTGVTDGITLMASNPARRATTMLHSRLPHREM